MAVTIQAPAAGFASLPAAGHAPGAGTSGELMPAPGSQIDAVDLFGGPGGWAVAMRALSLTELGIELDAAACATRRAAGHPVIRADVAGFPITQLAGRVRGCVASAPCTTFSAAGLGTGNMVTEILAAAIRDAFAGRDTRTQRRQEMGRVLHKATPARPTLGRRAHRIAAAVRSAHLVTEPARYIHAIRPEWVALEQVPSVLPLWQAYATELARLGYSVWTGKLNAADYGVPQTRIRAILIASRVRRVYRPEPTHYDPRKGDQLWGEPWVSMAEALGFGASKRPSPSVTAGGTATGGAEPFARGGRDALAAERDAGRWVLGGPYRTSPGDRTRARSMDEPATTVAFGHSSMIFPKDHAGVPEGPVLHTNRDQRPDGTRQTSDPLTAPAPAPALTAKSGGQWIVKLRNNNNNNNACERSPDEPAGTLFFGHRSNWAAWVTERPATCVQGDPRLGRPGHKSREPGGESQFAVDSVRITVEEAAALQSFPPGYPWQGNKSKRFEQCGNAIPPLLAEHILSMAAGIKRSEAAA